MESEKNSIFKPSDEISTIHEITAIQYSLEKIKRYPIVYINKPILENNTISEFPVVTNLTASREIVCRSLGIDDHRTVSSIYSKRTGNKIDPKIININDSPVKEIIQTNNFDLRKLPILKQHISDPGPYLTAAHATTYDPETKIDNTAIQRCWVKSKNKMTYFPYPSSHNFRNLQKFWSKKQPCPVVFWIGHHPSVLLGTQAKLQYPESHWRACGGLLGEPLRLTPSHLFGSDIMVPADAEIVIEGEIPPDYFEADGPFGEYTGYSGPQIAAPIVNVKCVTMRKNPIYHDYGSGLADMLVPDNIAMEGKVFNICKQVAPSVTRVHVPSQGRRFHAYITLDKPGPGEAKDVLMAALSYRRIKMAVVVNDDIDIFDDSEVMFSLATRVQWSRDSFTVGGLSGSLLDPSTPSGANTLSKIGIDATLPLPLNPNFPSPTPPRSKVPDNIMKKISKVIHNTDYNKWPIL